MSKEEVLEMLRIADFYCEDRLSDLIAEELTSRFICEHNLIDMYLIGRGFNNSKLQEFCINAMSMVNTGDLYNSRRF